ncbi:hypothetical protein [Pantoea stewartii]|uniref:hypothetical protein n=1 Tax=Pantoea stewartii TaxID=66269 RepID=UPI0025A078B4|nr:hypothetical protein [Pantoea stewartii]
MSQRTKGMLRMVQPDVADHRLVSRAADRFERGHSVVARVSRYSTITTIREQKSTQAMLSGSGTGGVQLSTCGDQNRCVVNPEAGRFGEDSSWMILAGK